MTLHGLQAATQGLVSEPPVEEYESEEVAYARRLAESGQGTLDHELIAAGWDAPEFLSNEDLGGSPIFIEDEPIR